MFYYLQVLHLLYLHQYFSFLKWKAYLIWKQCFWDKSIDKVNRKVYIYILSHASSAYVLEVPKMVAEHKVDVRVMVH